MDTMKPIKKSKQRETAITRRRDSFAQANSKLCLGQPEMLRASQDKLALPFGQGGFLQSRKPQDVANKFYTLNN